MDSNFVRPPNDIDDTDHHSVLIIDPENETVTDLEMLCRAAGSDFDVYVYHHLDEDLQWLETAFNLSDAVVINNSPSPISPIKDRLVFHQKSFNYGPKNYLKHNKKLQQPEDYFLLYIQRQLGIDLTE